MLQDRLVHRLTQILLQAQALQLNNLELLKGRLMEVEKCLSGVDTSRDQELFIEYNIRPFSAPKDWKFEPCPNFYDNVRQLPAIEIIQRIQQDSISVDPAPKVFLQNKLSRSQSKLAELGPLVTNKRV